MRFADARLKASSISSSSIRLSLVGMDVDWMTNTSPPRTFSVISTSTSPSLKRPISAPPSGTPRWRLMASARGRFEFPVNSLISPFTERAAPPCLLELGGKESNLRCRIQSPVPCQLGYRPRPLSAQDRPLRKRRRLVLTPGDVNTTPRNIGGNCALGARMLEHPGAPLRAG